MIGKTLGPYRIVDLIGSGGMGEVYRAWDTRLERDVAVKVLPAQLANDTSALARFEREAKAVAALSHPNILGIFDVGADTGISYAVMELLQGETLRMKLANGALPARKAIEYGAQIAKGLAAAHDQGIVHRDLKPENVFVTSDGRAKILDFGIAKQGQSAAAIDATDSPTLGALTVPGMVMGTIAYMAPEQARGLAVDHRADIFSFGALLYEMITGRPAFLRGNATDTMVAILTEDPPDWSAVEARSHSLVRLIQHCVEKDPVARYQSTHDLAFALDALAVYGATTLGELPSAASARRWRRLGFFGLIGLVILAAGIFAGLRMAAPVAQGEIRFETKTFDPQFISNARFLPDGKGVVFSAATEGNLPELFVLREGDATPKPLRQPRTHLLSVSSKGELAVLTSVSYLGQKLYRGTLARMPLDGAPKEWMTDVREADWGPNGLELAVIHDTGNMDKLEYPRGKVIYSSSGYLSDLRVSPDGKRVAFFEHPMRIFDDRGHLKVVDSNGVISKLTEEFATIEGLAWTPDGNSLAFSPSNVVNENQPHIVTIPGNKPARQALPSIGAALIEDIDRNGNWIVVGNETVTSVHFRMPSERNEREFSWWNTAYWPFLSADGQLVLFTDQSQPAGPNYAVCYRKVDSPQRVHLGEGTGRGFSPDSKMALALIPNPPQLVIYPIGPGETIRLSRGPIERYQSVQWFPDGKHVLFCGNEPSKPSRCYEQPIYGGPPIAVTPDGITNALVAPDGHMLLIAGANGINQVMSIGGLPKPIPGMRSDDIAIKWAKNSQSLFVQTGSPISLQVEKLNVLTGRREPLQILGPSDHRGLLFAGITDILSEGEGYAYWTWKQTSKLYIAHGVRP
jgi:eukaryotic-like serine/threonine-protein kinase